MANVLLVPHQIFTGENALTEAGASICALGKKALIVTDPFMIKFGNVAKVEEMLKGNNAPYAIFSDITGEPTDKMVEAGLKVYADEGCDYLIALGGGSCIGGSMDRTMHPSRTSATIFFNLLICNAPFYACRRHTHTILPYSIKHCI